MIDFLKILRMLTEAEVDFVLVGALSAALQGAQVSTFDVDIVHDRSEDNVGRIKLALEAMNARYRGRDEIVPSKEHLRSSGHQLLITEFGPLDVLGAIEDGLDYGKLLDCARTIAVDDFEVRVLPLSEYVRIRHAYPRPRDKARFPILEAALREEE